MLVPERYKIIAAVEDEQDAYSDTEPSPAKGY